MKEIWLLLSTGILTGDAAVDGAEQIGTRASAYATREAACDDLREFMRPDVDESRPERAWDDGDMTVDDALDLILDSSDDLESDGSGLWAWDGTVRSYEWKLMRLEVAGRDEGTQVEARGRDLPHRTGVAAPRGLQPIRKVQE